MDPLLITNGGQDLELVGTISTADLLTNVSNPGANLQIDSGAELDNSGATLSISPGLSFASVTLLGGAGGAGEILGGTIYDPNGALNFQGGLLDGVTYQGPMNLLTAGSSVYIQDGLTLVGQDGVSPSYISLVDSTINFANTETLDNLTIDLSGASTLNQYSTAAVVGNSNATETLTLGANALVEITGAGSAIDGAAGPGFNLIVNSGLISVATDNGTAYISSPGFTNNGTIIVDDGNTLNFEQTGLTNLSGSVFGGGTWLIYSGAALILPTSSDAVTVLEASVTLTGAGSELLSGPSGQTLDQTLTEIGAGGNLHLETFRVFSPSGPLTIDVGGELSGAGVVTSAIVNNGQIVASGGDVEDDLLDLQGAVTGTGGLAIQPLGTLELGSATSETVSFVAGSRIGGPVGGPVGPGPVGPGPVGVSQPATLILDDPADFTGAVAGLAVRDKIDLTGVTATSVTFSNGVLSLFNGVSPVATLNLTGDFTGESFGLATQANGVEVTLNDTPSAGAPPTLTAANGAAAEISFAAIEALIIDHSPSGLAIESATLAPGSAGAGTLTLDDVNQQIDFTAAAGFAGPAVAEVTLTDAYGATIVQTIDLNVVVQASPPVVTLPDTTTTTVNGNVTTIQTFSPTADLIGTETITVNGADTLTTFADGNGVETSSTLQQNLGGGLTEFQSFDGTGHQLSATLTQDLGGGDKIVQSFDGSWNQTGATETTVQGAATIVQTFDASWNQLSAVITTLSGNVTETQNFDANWHQTSAALTTQVSATETITQDFDANWVQTSAAIATQTSATQTVIQDFDANWVQTGATVATVNGDQTTTQIFDANWNQTGATILTTLNAGGIATELFTYNANWVLQSEVGTATNGGQSYFVYGQPGGNVAFAAAASHSTTFVFDPGQVGGDTIAGLHTLNLGGSIHDVIDFEGFGTGAQLEQVDATHWEVVSTNNPTEVFTLTGGATLAAGDYFFHG